MNKSDSWAWADSDQITHIDGFGVPGALWPSGLPVNGYWTGTEDSDSPGNSWLVSGHSGEVIICVAFGPQSDSLSVVCVP